MRRETHLDLDGLGMGLRLDLDWAWGWWWVMGEGEGGFVTRRRCNRPLAASYRNTTSCPGTTPYKDMCCIYSRPYICRWLGRSEGG